MYSNNCIFPVHFSFDDILRLHFQLSFAFVQTIVSLLFHHSSCIYLPLTRSINVGNQSLMKAVITLHWLARHAKANSLDKTNSAARLLNESRFCSFYSTQKWLNSELLPNFRGQTLQLQFELAQKQC